MDAKLKIFVGTYNSFNAGRFKGEWITLPCDEDELDEALERIAEGFPKDQVRYVINDYESDIDGLEVLENDSIYKLNEFMEEVCLLDGEKLDLLEAYLEDENKEDALKYAQIGEGYLIHADSFKELGQIIVDKLGGVENLRKSTLEAYFDYKSCEHDLEITQEDIEMNGGIWNLDTLILEDYFDYESYGEDIAADAFEVSSGFLFKY